MKLNEVIFTSVLIQLLFSGGLVMPFPAVSEVPSDQVSTADITMPNDVQIEGTIGAPFNQRPTANNNSTLPSQAGGALNQAENGFQFRNILFPHHFGEFFEVFEFFVERRWHQEIEETIKEVAEKIIRGESEEEVQEKNDHFNIPTKKYYPY